MQGFFRYWGLVFWTAFRHSSSLAQNVLFGLLVAGGLLAWLVPPIKAAMKRAELDMTGWEMAGMVLTTIFGVRLLLAPYWIYQEQAAKLAKQAQNLKNKLTKRAIREQIAKFIDEGRPFLLQMQRDHIVPSSAMTVRISYLLLLLLPAFGGCAELAKALRDESAEIASGQGRDCFVACHRVRRQCREEASICNQANEQCVQKCAGDLPPVPEPSSPALPK